MTLSVLYSSRLIFHSSNTNYKREQSEPMGVSKTTGNFHKSFISCAFHISFFSYKSLEQKEASMVDMLLGPHYLQHYL
jgi:hypothetical protein